MPRSGDEIRRLSDQARQQALRDLRREVDFESGRGLRQVYGGLGPGGAAGTGLLVMIPAGGGRLTVRLRGLEGGVAGGAVEVRAQVDGAEVGTITVPPGEVVERELELPIAAKSRLPAREVALLPDRWGLVTVDELSRLAAFEPLRIAVR